MLENLVFYTPNYMYFWIINHSSVPEFDTNSDTDPSIRWIFFFPG